MENLVIRKVKALDGLHYSFGLIDHYYEELYPLCSKINTDNKKVIPTLARCWGFVDALHRAREISQAIPGLGGKNPHLKSFLKSTVLAKEYRHYIQHLRRELNKQPTNTFPVWGVLSWIDEYDETKSHTAWIGARLPGTTYSGHVFDTVNKKWVSRVSLSIAEKSFNFDPIYEAVQQFEAFVIPWIIEKAGIKIKVTNELPIISMKAVINKDS
ncbi:MAG: hypothetical protein KAV42_08260 [Candidatus Krumholzibacteria bacterium]|nr:hypothetical protein [Candidatus Krumholzibacteria bacterium]